MSRVAAIQMTSGLDVSDNLSNAKSLIAEAAQQGAKLIVLPEMFAIMGMDQTDKIKYREEFGKGMIQAFLRDQAVAHDVWIVGGTIPIAIPDDSNKVFAASLVFNNQGHCVARYDKIHLFDVEIPESKETHSESKTTVPGNEVVVVDSPFGKLGIAVCYDLRFPELFRLMQARGVEIIILSAAFTFATGSVHWDVLIKARAIENQMYLIAAAQTGHHANNRKTYGHSMIVNPWGKVVSSLADGQGSVLADIDLAYLHQLRGDFPVLKHRKY